MTSTPSADDCMDLVRAMVGLQRAFAVRLSPILLERFGIDMRLFVLIKRIEGGGAHPGELARMGMEPPSQVTRQIDKLVVLGFVTRTLDEEDSRRIRLVLTDKAKGLLEAVDALMVRLIGPAYGTLAPGARAELVAGLRRIAETLPPL